ncbi:MAG: glycosyltransferase involved in cell wall biosynthesis [Oceanicoccus sp.]|jgi:glycosyltransferase involved in cell wall biosynthesis
MRKILFLVNDVDFFLSHRLAVAIAAKKSGYKVLIAAGGSSGIKKIQELGFTYFQIPFSRSGLNPLRELLTLWEIFKLFKNEGPDLVHLVTIKPVLYGGLVSRLTGVKAVVAAVSGLGTVFVSDTFFAKLRLLLVKALYRTAFKHKNIMTIFQNPDDRNTVVELSGLPNRNTSLIRGSGVSLKGYTFKKEPAGKAKVVMAARLLVDKGVHEFIDAARILNKRGVEVEFRLIGSVDPGNNTSLSQKEFDTLKAEGLVQMLGYRQDISEQYRQANIVCLPSYREGLPKGLIEAAACGRAVVTTDVAGCRDAITPDITGLLVPVKDSAALADAIEQLIENPDQRMAMGAAGRKLAEEAFTIEHVVQRHMDIYQELLSRD